MSQLDILICGAGIAGSTLAYWLGKAGHNVTIIERAPEIRNSGLGVDIRGPAVEIIRRMGLEEQIRSRHTGEEGLSFIDSKDRVFAHFGIDQDNLETSPTSEFEIMRSDLAQLLIGAALDDPHVKIEYGTSVEVVQQDDKKVSITYKNGNSATFDLVIAADGLGSSTRKLLLGESTSPGPVHSIGQFTAYYSIPREERDGKVWKWYTAPGRRIISTRPKNAEMSCVYLSIMPGSEAGLPELMKRSVAEQKAGMKQLFENAGWETPRLLSAMETAPDFYLQHIAQVKLPTWHSGRCALVGDAAYCPSPLSGVGTSLALLGAYVLAGEIVNSRSDHVGALRAYEEKLRPYIEEKQKLPPGVPWIVNPKSAWGVLVLEWVIWFIARSGVTKLFGGGSSDSKDGFTLPDYKFE